MRPGANLARTLRPTLTRQLSGIAPKLSINDLNQATLEAKYAVRGKIPIRADELRSELSQNKIDQFDEIISANIGNPQQLDQKPLPWYRQTLALLQYPELIEKLDSLDHQTKESLFPSDVIERALTILGSVKSVGAYSHSQGDIKIRESVAKFISKRDDYPASPENIFLTAGASEAVSYLVQILSNGEKTGFLIPIPQYPLYTASIALNKSVPIGYYLDEANKWSIDPEQIRTLIKENKEKGVIPRCLVLINPGNPTGSILREQDIREIIKIAATEGLVIIADEVYQENVFEGKFISTKKVLGQMLEEDKESYKNVQLASLHSTSKGISGECGQRGGYMELFGFSKEVEAIIFKLACINLCSVVTGQALVELMINPPAPGSPSYKIYQEESSKIHESLRERSTLLFEAFSKMTDISCNKPEGAMYLFPKLEVTKETYPQLFEESESTGSEVDELYCEKLLEATGICTVPGSGFGQVPGTYHLRTTFLAPGSDWIDRWGKFHEKFVAKYKV